MSFTQLVSMIKDIVTVLALLFGAAAGLFVFFQFAPVLVLRIVPTWVDESKQFLILKFEVENKSRIRIKQPRGHIQILEYPFKPGMTLSQWVPFERRAIPPSEPPVEWREPEKIFRNTLQLYPGEVTSFEKLRHYPQDTVIIHAGLQVYVDLGFIGKIVNRKREPWRQTVTCIVVKQGEAKVDST